MILIYFKSLLIIQNILFNIAFKSINFMDESHRLKPMDEGYNRKLFLSIYKETAALRRKLAFDIDSRKFGVDYREILSWFDVKLLFVFQKYQHDEKVKGYVINALRTYKHRIIMNSYLPKNELHQTMDVNDCYELSEFTEEPNFIVEEDTQLSIAKRYLKTIISEDAFFLLELELNPPPYILNQLANPEQKKIPKPNAEIIAEYLGIDDNEFAIDYIEKLRKEIKVGIDKANSYFRQLDWQQ